MSEQRPEPPGRISLAEVAQESPEESVARERKILGDAPDTGGPVPQDDAQ